MITLTIEEAQTVVKSYAYLIELGDEHQFDLRSEEYRIYNKLTVALQQPSYNDIAEEAERESRESGYTLPHPPADPHREEDAYVPNIIE